MALPALLLLFALSGCANPYEDAKKADTIEAYEKFLAEHADDPKAAEARARLAELSLEEVRKNPTLEAYDAFLEKFPKGKASEAARKERKPLEQAWAEKQDTVEGWQRLIDDYGKADRKLMITSQRRLAACKNRDFVGIGALTQTQINMAGDPKGALDGWEFKADITNKGDKPARQLNLALVLTKDDGTEVTTREWPVVAKRLPQALPLPPGFDTPMTPSETRTWDFKANNLPEGWTKATLRLADVRWVEEKAAPEDATDKAAPGEIATPEKLLSPKAAQQKAAQQKAAQKPASP